MGDKQYQPFQLSFNPSLKVEFQGSRVTSDGGLILVRELDERLGFAELIEEHLTDPRRGKNTQFPLADLLRQSIYSRLAGYQEVNDAERLSQDPTFPLIGWEKIWERGAALTSRLQSFETEMLTEERKRTSPVWHGSTAKRPLRIHLLSPAAAVQPRGGVSGGEASAWERAQRRRLGRTSPAGGPRGHPAAAEAGQGSCVPR